MNKTQAKLKYKKYADVIEGYDNADQYAWINIDDPDLYPIRIRLPSSPEWSKIHGFGKPAEEQVFEYEEYPNALTALEKDIREEVDKNDTWSDKRKRKEIHKQFFDVLKRERKTYEEEIKWIKKQWQYRVYGKWIFINGKPTHIPGNFWMYLNYYHLEGGVGLPMYKDRDRRWYIAVNYFKTTTKIPVLDKEGKPVTKHDNQAGRDFIVTKDLGYRIWLGVNIMKARRVGDTSKVICDLLNEVMFEKEASCGIQANVGQTGEGIFMQKLIPAFHKLPIFFLPVVQNETQRSVIFNTFDGKYGLGSYIDFADNAKKSYYDSKKLTRYYGDEAAKVEHVSIKERHDVVKRCLMVQSEVVGFCYYTTTVDEADLSSAKEFAKMAKYSHYNLVGEGEATTTGLVNLFFAASDGDPDFLGKYGESIQDDPSPQQARYMKKIVHDSKGNIMGARKYRKMVRDHLTKLGDYEGLVGEKRQNPETFRDCFTPPAKNLFFDYKKLESRLNYLRFEDTSVPRRGRLVWISGRDTTVQFIDDPEGPFLVSQMPTKEQANRKVMLNGMYYPETPDKFVASADTFRLEKTDNYKMSDGAGAVRWLRDYSIDPEDTDVQEMQSSRLVCTYLKRPESLDEYFDDMIKMCVWYGALMYPEMNIDNLARAFINRGYMGYLLYDTDPQTGMKKNNPGYHQTIYSKQKIFNATKDEIDIHIERCWHDDWLEQCLLIKGLDDMTNYDLFVAVGGTLLAEDSKYAESLKIMNNLSFDVSGFWNM